MFRVERTSREDEHLKELVRMLDAELDSVYGNIQSQYNQYNSLASVDGAVLATANQQYVACGCFRRYNQETVEIKRMFVRTEDRGSGAAQIVLSELEKWAREAGYSRAILETGTKQAAAIRFYTKSGYGPIPNYDQYAELETSVCFAKPLPNL